MRVKLQNLTNKRPNPRYAANEKTAEERERDEWRRLPPVRHILLTLAVDKRYAIMMIDYNHGNTTAGHDR